MGAQNVGGAKIPAYFGAKPAEAQSGIMVTPETDAARRGAARIFVRAGSDLARLLGWIALQSAANDRKVSGEPSCERQQLT